MPAAFVKKVLHGDEKSWKEAKTSASRSGHSGDYKYIAGVSKIIAKNRKKKKMKQTNEGLSTLWKDIKAKFKSNKTGEKEAKATYNRAQGVQSKLGFTFGKSLEDKDVPAVYRKAASPEGAKKRDVYNKLGVTPDTKMNTKDRIETDKIKAANATKAKVRSAYTQSYKSGEGSKVRQWTGVVEDRVIYTDTKNKIKNYLRESNKQ